MQTVRAFSGKKKRPLPGAFLIINSITYERVGAAQKVYSSDKAVNVSVFSVRAGTSELFLTV